MLRGLAPPAVSQPHRASHPGSVRERAHKDGDTMTQGMFSRRDRSRRQFLARALYPRHCGRSMRRIYTKAALDGGKARYHPLGWFCIDCGLMEFDPRVVKKNRR